MLILMSVRGSPQLVPSNASTLMGLILVTVIKVIVLLKINEIFKWYALH